MQVIKKEAQFSHAINNDYGEVMIIVNTDLTQR